MFLLNPRQCVEVYFTPSAVLQASSGSKRRFQFQKRSQFFNSTDAVNFPSARTMESFPVAMCVNDPNCAPMIVDRSDPADAESGFAEIVSDEQRNWQR